MITNSRLQCKQTNIDTKLITRLIIGCTVEMLTKKKLYSKNKYKLNISYIVTNIYIIVKKLSIRKVCI